MLAYRKVRSAPRVFSVLGIVASVLSSRARCVGGAAADARAMPREPR